MGRAGGREAAEYDIDGRIPTGSDGAAAGESVSNSIYRGRMYGAFVRALREERGLTQRQLAEVSGIQQSNISAIESERRVPSANTLNRLVVACGFELSAAAGSRIVYCGLPRAGWFPDEDLPPPLPDDPADEEPVLSPDASPEERAAALTAVLEAAEAMRR